MAAAHGFDASNNNAPFDPHKLAAFHPGFVSFKTSQGAGYVDPYFPEIRAACNAAAVPFGGYHFADNGDPIAEADHFSHLLGSIRKGELRPTLDAETNPASAAWCYAFQARVEHNLGVAPRRMLYTYPDYLRRLGGWKGDDLWIADLSHAAGRTNIPSILHQYGWTGGWPGVGGSVDLDYANDLSKILAFPPVPVKHIDPDKLWYEWAAWRLGEGAFKPYGPANPTYRPKNLPTRFGRPYVPKAWWERLVEFLAARPAKDPRVLAMSQEEHSALRGVMA